MFSKVNRVSSEFLNEYIDCWTNRKTLPSNDNLLYCKNGNKYVGVDNTTNDCWVEEFDSKRDVLKWLHGVEKENFGLGLKKDRGDAR